MRPELAQYLTSKSVLGLSGQVVKAAAAVGERVISSGTAARAPVRGFVFGVIMSSRLSTTVQY